MVKSSPARDVHWLELHRIKIYRTDSCYGPGVKEIEHEQILTTDDEQRRWEESQVPPGVPFVLPKINKKKFIGTDGLKCGRASIQLYTI
jgi:hypothetical protein